LSTIRRNTGRASLALQRTSGVSWLGSSPCSRRSPRPIRCALPSSRFASLTLALILRALVAIHVVAQLPNVKPAVPWGDVTRAGGTDHDAAVVRWVVFDDQCHSLVGMWVRSNARFTTVSAPEAPTRRPRCRPVKFLAVSPGSPSGLWSTMRPRSGQEPSPRAILLGSELPHPEPPEQASRLPKRRVGRDLALGPVLSRRYASNISAAL
jgi:hypothetical protein